MAGRRPFGGWRVVAALAWTSGVTVGVSFYGVSVYLEALTTGPGALPVAVVSLATGAFLLVSGVSGLGVAALLDRLDPRWVVGGGAVLVAAAVLGLGRVQTSGELLAAYAVLGVGFAATAAIPASTLVARWFVRRRTTALSLAFLGLPIGGAVLTPPVALLVDELGVAGASPWLAGGLLVAVLPAALLLRADPASAGQRPDGDAGPPLPPAGDGGGAPGVGPALRTGWFWVVTAALTLGMLGQVGTLSHLFSAVTQRLDTATAALAVSVTALASLAGRLAGSWLLARVRLAPAAVALLAVQGLATAATAVASGAPAVVGAAALFGVTMGNLQVLHPLLVAERFGGGRAYGRVLAASNLVVTAGMAGGPAAVGAVRAQTGGYTAALCLAGAAALAGAAVLAAGARTAGRPVAAGPGRAADGVAVRPG
ncbi:MFS transporter [Geodermatophilus sp. SYSU D01106]